MHAPISEILRVLSRSSAFCTLHQAVCRAVLDTLKCSGHGNNRVAGIGARIMHRRACIHISTTNDACRWFKPVMLHKALRCPTKQTRRLCFIVAVSFVTTWLICETNPRARFLNKRCKEPQILVGIFTAAGSNPKHANRRAVIRSALISSLETTGLHSCALGITAKFVVGRVSKSDDYLWEREFKNHKHQFLTVDVADTYRNLPQKTVAYFQDPRLRGYEYVMKIDDDQYLFPARLSMVMDQWQTMNVDYIGCMTKPTEVHTNQSES
jgi:hypothetical protein